MMRSEGLRPRPWDPDYWHYAVPSPRYEYKCPHCGKVNVRSADTRRLVCSFCGRGFWS